MSADLERWNAGTLARPLALPASLNPARRYLRTLKATSSRATMGQALATVAVLLQTGAPPAERLTPAVVDKLLDTMPWHEITVDQAAELHATLCAGYSARTVNKLQAALRGTLKEAQAVVRQAARDARKGTEDGAEAMRIAIMSQDRQDELAEAIEELATVKAEVADGEQGAGREVDAGEITRLAEACADGTAAGARNAAMLAVAYVGGLRRAEIAALDLEHFDSASGVLTVVRGKGNRRRRLTILNGARRAIDAWLEVRGDEAGPFFAPINKGGSIERDADGRIKRLTPQSVRYIFDALAGKAHVAPFTPHDLRRSFIGNLLDTGADIVTAQRLAGHASPTTTANYDRRGERAKVEAVKRLSFPYVAPAQKRAL